MARDFAVGERIFVPSYRIPALSNHPAAFYQTTVAEVLKRSVRVNLPGQEVSEFIGMGLCHKNVAIFIICIGDLETEPTLLDPTAKSIVQFCRLLVDDSYLRYAKVRSLKELGYIWVNEQAAYSHVILLGHGSENGVKFFHDGWVHPSQLMPVLRVRPASKKVFISLCCETGKNNFSTPFSKMTTCSQLIAPFHSVHGAIASQFTQTFLSYHLYQGESVAVAMRHTIERTPGGPNFRLWENGKMIDGPIARGTS